jgi:hypothetical protein
LDPDVFFAQRWLVTTIAGVFTFTVGSKPHASSTAVREFYAGGLESASECRHGRTVRGQSAQSSFEAFYSWERYA